MTYFIKHLVLIVLSILVYACAKKSDLDAVSQKHPYLTDYITTIKSDTLVFEKCDPCSLLGLDNGSLMGYTNRVRPTGHFFRKDIEIGDFEFDSYVVYEKKGYNSNDDAKHIYKRVYFCYFDEKQKKIFNQFLHYYRNLIMHGKQMLAVKFIHNTAVITIQREMY